MCYLESSSVGNRNGMEYKRFTFVLWATVNAHIQISWFTWEMYSYEVHQLWLSSTKNVSCGKERRQKPNQIASLSEIGMSDISFLSYCWWWLLFLRSAGLQSFPMQLIFKNFIVEYSRWPREVSSKSWIIYNTSLLYLILCVRVNARARAYLKNIYSHLS